MVKSNNMKCLLNFFWPFFGQMASALAFNPNAVLCPLSEYYDDSDQKVREFYECPSPEDPPDHTRCCETESCCKLEHIDSVLGLDLKIAMIISLCVIVFCVFTGVVIIICCFAHQCPWYDTCSGSWDKDQSSIAPGMILTLPPEEEEVEQQQLLATKDTNGKVTHVIVKDQEKQPV